jgi:hypothetical protein
MKELLKRFLDIKIIIATLTNITVVLLGMNVINKDQFDVLNTLLIAVLGIATQFFGVIAQPNSTKIK